MAELKSKPELPPAHDWRTTDADEIAKRQMRAREERFRIENLDPRHPVCSNFQVHSSSARSYSVEVRDPSARTGICTCVDFRVNNLGTCKHLEAVWLQLQRRQRGAWTAARQMGGTRFEVVPDLSQDCLRLQQPSDAPRPAALRRWFDDEGNLKSDLDPEESAAALRRLAETTLPALRVSQEVDAWLEHRRRARDRQELRRAYELKVQSGEWPSHETLVPLFPYQRDGMLHLAFTERALLADEMGLGKTIQAIAACALLHRLGRARRVLVVTPASLKAEWEEQIRRFTALPCLLVFGSHHRRCQWLASLPSPPSPRPSPADPFFVVMNYEQVVTDLPEINAQLAADVVILDEAQRIKNWNTKIARTIKQLSSRYAFVLTGTPIENRIDELRSLVDFLDPALLGPLFRFNRDFYLLDDRGRPAGYRNLDLLHQRVRPLLLRRRKAEVETELPPRTDENRFVKMTDGQRRAYAAHEQEVMRLVHAAERRPLTVAEQERLQRELAMMRMVCDTPFILNPKDRSCPKLAELAPILENVRDNDLKLIVFSEWEKMLQLVRDLCAELGIDAAWHTGSVPQQKRRGEIQRFKTEPACRVFLSTDAGATGLNLQNASVVVNCDLPWNPARLEQRIARAWRKHQTRSVTVINLIADDSLESRMLDTLATKRAVAESVLDLGGTVKEIPLRSGRKAMMDRVRDLVGSSAGSPAPSASAAGSVAPPPPRVLDPEEVEREQVAQLFRQDPAAAFARVASRQFGKSLAACEERYPQTGGAPVLLFVVDADLVTARDRLEALQENLLGRMGDAPSVFDSESSPLRFEVVDRATYEAIQRLTEAGLLATTVKFSRPLSLGGSVAEPPALSAAAIAAVEAFRTQARHLLRRAKVLGEAGFTAECRASLLEACWPVARAVALEARRPEPDRFEATLLPPYAASWGTDLLPLRNFHADPASPCEPVAELLARRLT